jgi:NAD+ synthase
MKIRRAYFPNGPEKAVEELSKEIIEWTEGTGANGGVVGLSGGIDSTTVAYLCQYAFRKYNFSHEKKLKLYGVIMPSRANSPEDEKDGLRVARALGLEEIIVPIEPLAESFVKQISEIKNEFDRGNLYAEVRAIVLSRIAAVKNCRVMGTGNRDEDYVLGYFTKRGDGAVDNNILGKLPKRLVRELASHLGVPNDLVKRVPTAGLWQGQTDEGELGYSYEQAELIKNGFDQKFSSEEIAQETGFPLKIIRDVMFRNKITEHKRNVPPVGKVKLEYQEVPQ